MHQLITRLRRGSRTALGSTLATIVSLPLAATVGLGLAPAAQAASPETSATAATAAEQKAKQRREVRRAVREAVPLHAAVPRTGAAAADDEFDALVFSKTAAFRHGSIPAGIAAIQQLGTENGFTVTATEDAGAFTDANLEQYEVVIFLSTTGDVLNDAQQAAFERYIQAGGGYAGIHAASDTEYSWPWYGELVGSYFASHPPGTPTATVKVEDPAHPSTAGIEPRWERTDEWYNFRSNPRGQVHVLASLDETTYTPGNGAMGAEHPIAWCQDYDGGRSWYTGMGHTDASFAEEKFLGHLLGGIRTAAGVEGSDCAATLEDSFEKVALDENTSNPMELDIADDGRVFYVDRNGAVRIIKPNGTVVTAGTIPVYTGQEFGLLGIALDPDFASNNWVYLYYSPQGAQALDRIARYTMAGDTLQLDTATTILDVPTQREQCCHAGGSMEFDNDGNLYLATGDNTNPFDSGGYTPIDERPNRGAWDAQRTSGNTNSLNGKVLRITPLAEGGYAIPEGNLFDEEADTDDKTRPEIYAMGFRNPFRIGLDEQNNNLLVADYGPDAGAVSATRGPNGRVEWNILDEPGNYGWPYCVGDNTPYNDYNFANSTAGPAFDCAALVNDSPHNTGLRELPPAKAAVMWQSNDGAITSTPEIGASGAPMTSGTYAYDPDLVSDRKWPAYFDRKAIWADWNNSRLFTVQMNLDGTNYTDVNRFLPNLPMVRPHALQFGPDGALYMIEWGSGFNGNNTDSGVYRIDYVEGNRAPIARVTTNRTSGPVPLTVEFDGSGSFDADTGDAEGLTYAWDFDGDGTTDATTPTGSFTYTEAGNYTARLTVTDEGGRSGTTNIDIVAGNTAPSVELVLPVDGGFFDFGDYLRYEVEVSDPEDGEIDCERVVVQPGLGHDEHSHDYEQYRGCSGVLALPGDSGHVGANIFGTIKATYTDDGNGEAGPLTSVDGIIVHTKRKEAEYFDATGRTGEGTDGTPGVTVQTTTDTGGGQQVTGIETGDWFRWDVMNLTGIDGVTMRVASASAGAAFEIRQGSPTGTAIGTVEVPNTGGAQAYQNVSTTFEGASADSEELYVVATSGGASVNWLRFDGRGITDNQPPQVELAASTTTGEAPLPVEFTSTVEDPDGDTPLTYAWDFGDGETSTEVDPSHTYTAPGRYVVELVVTDARGARGSGTLEIVVTRPADTCFSGRSDDFVGDALDTERWNRSVRVDQSLSVADGVLTLPITATDIYQGTNTTPNIVLQDLPSGAFEVTTKVTLPATRAYQQAGLIVYGDDDNYLKLVYSGRSTTPNKANNVIQLAKEVNASASETNSANLGADFPDTVWLRLSSTDGTVVTGSYSSDGDTWTDISPTRDLSGITAPKVGLLALGNQADATGISAGFDHFTLTPDDTAEPCDPGCLVEQFDGSALGGDWDVVRPSGNLTVSGGTVQIPLEATDLYQGTNTARDLVLTDLPDGPFVATTKVSAPIDRSYQSAGLLLYGDDDNYIKHVFQGRSDQPAAASNIIQTAKEVGGTATETNTSGLGADFPSTVWLRLTSEDGTEVIGSYSADGETWTEMSAGYDLTGIDDPRIGLLAAANTTAGAGITASFDYFTLGTDSPCEPGEEPGEDEEAPQVDATVLGSYAGEVTDIAGGTIGGEATLVSAAEGEGRTTTATLELTGLDPQARYESHLHIGDCGGFEGHYRDDPDGPGTPPNELWPTNPGWEPGSNEPRIKPAADGTSSAVATVPWAPRIDGRSLVVHRDGAIVACADLDLTGPGTVALDASDDVGVATLTYTVDGGEETEYDGPFEITEPGTHEVAYTATDEAGNETTGSFEVVVPDDDVETPAPTVSITTTPASPNGRGDWFTSPVTVAIAGDGGDGDLELEYRFGTGGWTPYTGPVRVNRDGITRVSARATDEAGTVSEVATTTVRLDATAPSVRVAGIKAGARLGAAAVRTARVSGSDATSGVASVEVRLDGSVVRSPVRLDAMRLRTGTHRLVVRVTDQAGNRTSRTTTFRVVATYPGAKQLVRRLQREKTVAAPLARSLVQAVTTAQRADRRGKDGQARQALTRFQTLSGRVRNAPARTALTDLARQLKKQL